MSVGRALIPDRLILGLAGERPGGGNESGAAFREWAAVDIGWNGQKQKGQAGEGNGKIVGLVDEDTGTPA